MQPNYPAWQKINAQALLYGQASVVGGALQVDFRICDVFAEKELKGCRSDGESDESELEVVDIEPTKKGIHWALKIYASHADNG